MKASVIVIIFLISVHIRVYFAEWVWRLPSSRM